MPATTRPKPILSKLPGTFYLLVVVGGFAVAAHLILPDSWSPLEIKILQSLHGPGFAILAMILLWFFRRQGRSVGNYVLAAGIAMGIGVISEIAQIPGTRDAQFKDLVIDAVGVFGSLGIAASLDPSVRRIIPGWAKATLPVAAVSALAIAFSPTLWFGYAYGEQHKEFPSLLSFEKNWESATYVLKYPDRQRIVATPPDWPVSGERIYQGREGGRWGEFLGLKPMQDWRGYSALSFMAASGGNSFALAVAIHEKRSASNPNPGRFNARITVGPQAQRVRIEFTDVSAATQGRDFDFSAVETLVFSAAKPGNQQVLRLDDIRLEH